MVNLEIIPLGHPTHMNPAAEHVILWHLKRSEITEEEIGVFMPALTRGYDLRQADAVELVNQYLTIARTTSIGLDEQEIIEVLYRLHCYYEALDEDERLITAFEKIRGILAVKKDNPLADRIARAKIMAIETELARTAVR